MEKQDLQITLIELTTEIVAAYVSNNAVNISELPDLIQETHTALKGAHADIKEPKQSLPVPAVAIKKSITPNYLICLEDGKQFKSLKRHLRTAYNLSPQEYREKWGLSADYPMVAPEYAKQRSKLATKMGLGQKRKK